MQTKDEFTGSVEYLSIASTQRLMVTPMCNLHDSTSQLFRDQLDLDKAWGELGVCFPASEFWFLV